MASEYVSFMLVFALGISMVVGITISMQGLTSSVSENAGDVAMQKTLDQVKGDFINGVTSVNQWNGVSSYESHLDLSRLLVSKYSYEITVEVLSNTYYLVGKTIDNSVNITLTTSLNFNIHDFAISGTIVSYNSNPYILFQKNPSSLTITLGNR